MEKSEKFGFILPSRDSDDIADINQISDNFRIIDENIPSKDELKNEIEKEKIIVDQIYNSKSKNPQSGKAVAEAIAENKTPVDLVYNPESENAQSGIAVDEAIKQTYNIFANALKGTKSGAAVAVNDVSPIEQELKVNIRSKNLLPYPYHNPTQTIKGITYTVGTYGSLTIEGTATANATFNFILASYNSALPLKAGNYTLSLGTPNTAYTQFRLGTIDENGTKVVKADIKYAGIKEKAFTLEKDARIYMNCIVGEGDTVPKTTFYPQIEVGTTATEYTPYVADFSGVEVSRYGKNLLPYPYHNPTQTIKGITYTVGTYGSLTIEGTATANATFNFILASYNSALPLKAGNYTLSLGTPNTAYTQFRLGTIDENGTKVVKADIKYAGIKEKAFTLEKDARIYMNCIVGEGDTVPKTTFYPQIEIGTTATAYEPYNELQTATANADGTVEGLTSLSPNMTLVSDTEGVVINLEYNIDTKMYIDNELAKIKAELSAAIVNS